MSELPKESSPTVSRPVGKKMSVDANPDLILPFKEGKHFNSRPLNQGSLIFRHWDLTVF